MIVAVVAVCRFCSLEKHGVIELTLHEELINCGEYLFRPGDFLHEGEMFGVHQLIAQVIKKCPLEYRKQLMGNVVLSGGGTALKGFSKRLKTELLSHFEQSGGNQGKHVNVKAHPSPLSVVSFAKPQFESAFSLLFSYPHLHVSSLPLTDHNGCCCFQVWDGGATLTSLPNFHGWHYKYEWDEGVKDRPQSEVMSFA